MPARAEAAKNIKSAAENNGVLPVIIVSLQEGYQNEYNRLFIFYG